MILMSLYTRCSSGAARGQGGARPGTGVNASTSGSLERNTADVAEARRALERFLRRCRIAPAYEFDILVAVGEAVSNGVRYGRGERIRWFAAVEHGRVEVCVEYASSRFDTAPRLPDDNASSDGGRGLLLMHSLMDETRFEFRRGLVRVLMTKSVRPADHQSR